MARPATLPGLLFLALVAVVVVAGCATSTPGATSGATGPGATAPPVTMPPATAPPGTSAPPPTVAATAAPSTSTAVDICDAYLTAAELSTATGRTFVRQAYAGPGPYGYGGGPGTVYCVWLEGSEQLVFGIDPDRTADAQMESARHEASPEVIAGLGTDAVYSPESAGPDDINVRVGDVVFVITNFTGVALGKDAMVAVASLIVPRIPGPTEP